MIFDFCILFIENCIRNNLLIFKVLIYFKKNLLIYYKKNRLRIKKVISLRIISVGKSSSNSCLI